MHIQQIQLAYLLNILICYWVGIGNMERDICLFPYMTSSEGNTPNQCVWPCQYCLLWVQSDSYPSPRNASFYTQSPPSTLSREKDRKAGTRLGGSMIMQRDREGTGICFHTVLYTDHTHDHKQCSF